jgi:uncharacterized membrane protein
MDEDRRWGAFKSGLVALVLSGINCFVALDIVSYSASGAAYGMGALGLIPGLIAFFILGGLAAVFLVMCLVVHRRSADREWLQKADHSERAFKTAKGKLWASVQLLAGVALLAQVLSFVSLSDQPSPRYEGARWIPAEWGLVGEGYGMLNFQVLMVLLLVACEVLHVFATRARKDELGALLPGTH